MFKPRARFQPPILATLAAAIIALHLPGIAASAAADRGTGDGEGFHLLGRWARGPCQAVDVVDDLVFFADGAILRIADLSEPDAPALLGQVVLPSQIQDIETDGSLAYVADLDDGLRIVDCSNPASPHEVGVYLTPTQAVGVALRGSHAFVMDLEHGLQVLDIANPRKPVLAAASQTPRNRGARSADIELAGDFAYESYAYSDPYWSSWGGLKIYDIANPLEPVHVASDTLGFDPKHVCIRDDHLFAAWGRAGLYVVDVSDPTSPATVGHYEADAFEANDVAVRGDLAYVAAGPEGVVLFDISDPAAPQPLGIGWGEGALAQRVVLNGDRAYLAREDDGFSLLDISDPLAPSELASIDTGDAMGDVVVRGDLAYVTQRSDVLRIIDVSHPEAPVEIGVANGHASEVGDGPWGQAQLELGPEHAYVGGSGRLWIVDISDPAQPTVTGTLPLVSDADLALSGDYLYVANTSDGGQVVDVSDPTAPTVVAEFGSGSSWSEAQRLEIVGHYAYLVEANHGLRIYDISDPLDPWQVGETDLNLWTYALAIEGDTAYIGYDYEIVVVDISNPALPIELDRLWAQTWVRDLCVHDHQLDIAGVKEGVLRWDVADPLDPATVGSFDSGVYACGIDASAARIYVAQAKAGLWILGADTTPVALSDFDASATAGEVRATWALASEASPVDFRLIRGQDGAGQTEVAWAEVAAGSYEAIDRDPALLAGGTFRYSLFGRTTGEDWAPLRSESVTVPAAAGARWLAPHPNPFNPATELSFELAVPAAVNLSIYDVSGRQIATILDGVHFDPGRHSVRWRGVDDAQRPLASGIYYARFNASGTRAESKLVLLK